MVLVSPETRHLERRLLEEGNTVGLIREIRLIFAGILFLGIWPYLWYRDDVKAWVAFIGYVVCCVLWATYIVERPFPQNLGWIIISVGATCNQVAIWANRGMMPVKAVFEPHGLWRPMVESDRLKFLCDIYGGASIGDIIALSGLALCMIIRLFL